MQFLHHLFSQAPLLGLFITVALGYFAGKLRIKRFVLGGIAGSLLMGVLIGQVGIKLPEGIGTIFFALFIYAVGFQGGPQFFRSLNRHTAVQLISATITCVLGLACVLVAASVFHLDRGTAAGLAAGALTQSAMIGTASDAIARLGLSPHLIQVMQSQVAVGYAVCYIFGSFAPILLLGTIFPGMMGWDLRKEARILAQRTGSADIALSPGQFKAIAQLDTRVFKVAASSQVVGQSVSALFSDKPKVAVEAIIRADNSIEVHADTSIQADDIVAVTAKPQDFIKSAHLFGPEISKPEAMRLVEETRQVVLTRKDFDKKPLQTFYTKMSAGEGYGVFITSVTHMGERITVRPDLTLQRGDEIELVGRSQDLDKIAPRLGYPISKAAVTDFIFFGLGMAVGVLLGMITFRVIGISVTLGAGVGCLFSGLIFGWLRARHPRFGALPTGASNFLRDFGLTVFVAVIGLTAGPQAIETIKNYGLELFFLGVGVTVVPQVLTFYISYYILRIKNPITLLATIAGGRSANPGFAAILDKAGNSTPVVPFTATYAIANILLTLWGPIVVGLVTKNYA